MHSCRKNKFMPFALFNWCTANSIFNAFSGKRPFYTVAQPVNRGIKNKTAVKRIKC
jgi:hypothetical protein